MGPSSSPSLGPPGAVELASLDQKLQLLVPLLSGFQADLGVFFLPNKPVGILNRAKETREEAQGQLKASLKTKKPSAFNKTSKFSAGPIRWWETQIFTDFHQEQVLQPWREEAAIATRKGN